MRRDRTGILALARELVSRPERWLGLAASEDPELPCAVTAWLSSLEQLEGVPFDYLVPDDRALPPESLRFFTVDPMWIAAVQDGALSVGRSEDFDISHDAGVATWARATAHRRQTERRAGLLGRDPAAVTSTTTSGFLLRSAVVEGWPGLEVLGYGENQTPLTTVRQTLLSPSVLIALFGGALQSVTFQEPSEGIQFGATLEGGKRQIGQIRYTTQSGVTISTIGTPIQGSPATVVPYRSGAYPNVVDVAGLQTSLAAQAEGVSAYKPGAFAIELVEEPQQATVTLLHPMGVSAAPLIDPDALVREAETSLTSFIEEALA